MIFHPAATFFIGVQVANDGDTLAHGGQRVCPASLPPFVYYEFHYVQTFHQACLTSLSERLMLLLKQSILNDYRFGIGRLLN